MKMKETIYVILAMTYSIIIMENVERNAVAMGAMTFLVLILFLASGYTMGYDKASAILRSIQEKKRQRNDTDV